MCRGGQKKQSWVPGFQGRFNLDVCHLLAGWPSTTCTPTSTRQPAHWGLQAMQKERRRGAARRRAPAPAPRGGGTAGSRSSRVESSYREAHLWHGGSAARRAARRRRRLSTAEFHGLASAVFLLLEACCVGPGCRAVHPFGIVTTPAKLVLSITEDRVHEGLSHGIFIYGCMRDSACVIPCEWYFGVSRHSPLQVTVNKHHGVPMQCRFKELAQKLGCLSVEYKC